jgi:hypothetical protein
MSVIAVPLKGGRGCHDPESVQSAAGEKIKSIDQLGLGYTILYLKKNYLIASDLM